MTFYVAFECFQVTRRNEIKELCIINENGEKLCHGLLEMKVRFYFLSDVEKRVNRFLMFNYHHISYDEGYITATPLDLLNQNIPLDSHVICKGLENKKMIESLRRDLTVHDVDSAIPKVETINKQCFFHYKPSVNCALNKALYLYNSCNE